MISVLTLTYGRKTLLEEAIQSFINQNDDQSEMVIINDEQNVHYNINHPNVNIINISQRFESIGKKLEYGFNQCKYDHIYRLDDDDLLGPNALQIVKNHIQTNPNYDIYRSKIHYFFENNKYKKTGGSVNNGNIYTKSYLQKIKIPNKNFGEDSDMTFNSTANIFQFDEPTMIYRWGMNTYHLSGMGDISNIEHYHWTDKLVEKNQGIIDLSPKFNDNYYKQLI